jgi:acyl-coenzyme A synthetase/AMP-(fatty) acid ligase
MKYLPQRLEAVPDGREVLVIPERLSFSDLRKCQDLLQGPPLREGVILLTSRISIALRALVQLDGAVNRVLLASPRMPLATVWELGRRSECCVILTDNASFDVPDGFHCRELPDKLVSPEFQTGIGACQRRFTTQWLLATTGTTGTPKLVGHSLTSLTRTTKTDVNLGASMRWGLLYDFTRFAGLQVVLQALLSGSALIAPDPGSPLKQQITDLVSGGCTHLSATPTLWRKILMTMGSEKLDLKQVTLGGEIADQRILTALKKRYPGARVTHIYASTEAGVGFSVSDGLAGFPATFLENPPAGIELRIHEGHLQVRNPHVHGKYLGTGESFADEDGFVETGDLVERHGDRISFLGRASGVINVGGNKVHPERVERVLLEHPGVAEAKSYSRKSPITGALVAADVVACETDLGPAELRSVLLKHCSERLARHEVPATLQFVEDLDINESGKISRQFA